MRRGTAIPVAIAIPVALCGAAVPMLSTAPLQRRRGAVAVR